MIKVFRIIKLSWRNSTVSLAFALYSADLGSIPLYPIWFTNLLEVIAEFRAQSNT